MPRRSFEDLLDEFPRAHLIVGHVELVSRPHQASWLPLACLMLLALPSFLEGSHPLPSLC